MTHSLLKAGKRVRAIDKSNLKNVDFAYEHTKNAMIQAWGVSEDPATSMVEFMENLNQGRIFTRYEQTTPTSLEDFAPVFTHVYNQGT